MVSKGDLSAGHARPLIGLNNAFDVAKIIIQKKLSVRQSEILVRQFKHKKFKWEGWMWHPERDPDLNSKVIISTIFKNKKFLGN